MDQEVKERKKCKTGDIGITEFCPGVLRFLNPPATKMKGLSVMELVNMESHDLEVSGRLMMLRSGTDKNLLKRGIVVNFCPFCGTNVIDDFRAANEREMAASKAKEDAKLEP